METAKTDPKSYKSKEFSSASESCELNSTLDFQDGEAIHSRALVLFGNGQIVGAIHALTIALLSDDCRATWFRDLGLMHLAAGDIQPAVTRLRSAVELLPGDASALRYLGRALFECDDFEQASGVLAESLNLDPNSIPALNLLVESCCKLNRYEEAIRYAQERCRIEPDSVDLLEDLGSLCCNAGLINESVTAYRRAIARDPSNSVVASTMLGVLIHQAELSSTAVRLEHLNWAVKYCSSGRLAPAPKERTRIGRLRIGYICAEFHASPGYYFLLPLLSKHDKKRFETFFYYTSARIDEATATYQTLCDHWRDAVNLSDEELSAQVRADEIDVLVDISGHFATSRLPVFSGKIAPVQVSYPHYPCTTGISEIDYIFTDRLTCPDGYEGQYVEQPYFLASGYLAYRPMDHCPGISPLPALSNGFVTFGLFQRLAKMNERVWDAVARILVAVEDSHLLIHFSANLDEPESAMRKRIIGELSLRGVAEGRISFRGKRPAVDHLATISEADIALDTFPYNGQTTTCECLWMGVPVVNLAGDHHVARVGAGILGRVGLQSWIAHDVDGYVKIGIRVAQNIEELSKFRNGARKRLRGSSLLNGERIMKEIESAYEWMYEQKTKGLLA